VDESQPSRTAFTAALLRAAHQRFDGEPKVIADGVIIRLLDENTRSQLDSLQSGVHSPSARIMRSAFVLRSRFAEDELEAAAARGVKQYVILGAGLDTFAFRQPAYAAALRIFEVDRRATQRWKRRRLAECGITEPGNLIWVPTDFEEGRLAAALESAGFSRTQPACVSWLGVTQYLSEQAINAVLLFAASLPGPSTLILTFMVPDADLEGEELEAVQQVAQRAAAEGELWRTRFRPQDMRQLLTNAGFTRVFLPSPEEADARYFSHRQDALRAPRAARLASAYT
jgi:methyltransferase (TIGR00027 family)